MSQSAVIKNFDFAPDENWQKNLIKKLGWPFQFCLTGPEGLNNSVDSEDIILIFPSVKSVDGKNFQKVFEMIFKILESEYPGIVNYPAYQTESDQKVDTCITNKYAALPIVEERHLNLNNTSSVNTPYQHGYELHESDDNETGFQVVKKQRRRKKQQYSLQCKFRSNCKKGIDCEYHHTDDEKKFFRNRRKDKECWHKGHCKYGPGKCLFAHSNDESFCRNCHRWGHLQEKCPLK